MKRFDSALSNGAGITLPPATAHSGASPQHVGCSNTLYSEYFADYQEELANVIEAVEPLDGTRRDQLLGAIQSLIAASAGGTFTHKNRVTLASGSSTASATVAFSGDYATADAVQLLLTAESVAGSAGSPITMDITGPDPYGEMLLMAQHTSGAAKFSHWQTMLLDTSVTHSVTYSNVVPAGSASAQWRLYAIGIM